MNGTGDGVGSKIFTSKMNPLFIGRTFSAVAYFLFNEFQVILFAVATKLKDGSPHLLLNPGKSYLLKSGDELHYIAQSDNDIFRITKMVSCTDCLHR
jgi:hypothetical protein